MSAVLAIKALAGEFAKIGIPANRIEIVLGESDVERIRKEMRRASRTPAASSVQKIAGVLVSGIASSPDHSHLKMGDLLNV